MTDLQNLSDIELIKKFIESKDKTSFGELYRRYIRDVYRFVYSRVGDKHASEDIVSETFFTLIDVLHMFNGTSKLKTFIFGIAFNKTKQYYDKLVRANSVTLEEDFIILKYDEKEEKIDNSINENTVRKILSELPIKYRSVLEARFLSKLNIKETAKELKLTEANVRVIQKRALDKAFDIAKKLKINT